MTDLKLEDITPRDIEDGDNAFGFDQAGNPIRTFQRAPFKVNGGRTLLESKAINFDIGDEVSTTGYTTLNDGGGASYIIVGGGTGTDNGGSYINMANGNQLELIRSYVIDVKTFGAIANGTAGPTDTDAAQNAIDYAQTGGTVRFSNTGGSNYYITNLFSNKSLTIDLDGSDLTLAPSLTSLTDSNPAFSFRSDVGASYNLVTPTTLSARIELASSGDASNFSEGQYILLKDLFSQEGWDENIGGSTSRSYSGRSEITRIKSISGAFLNLDKPIEFLYSSTDSGSITPVTSPIIGAKIINSGIVSEIDPGGPYVGSSGSGPHLFAFEFCIDPLVENIQVDGFQLHAVQFGNCMTPVARLVTAKNPFRPTVGGHGYCVQFDRATSGASENIIGYGLRHLVDFTQAYDCKSSYSAGFDPISAQFYCHGQAAKRCSSTNDTVYLTDDSSGTGWQSGNPAFNADFDYTVTNPTVLGGVGTSAIISMTLSERMKVINPNFKFTKTSGSALRCIEVSSGAKDTLIVNGRVDASGVSGSASDTAIYSRNKTENSDLVGIDPDGLTIEGTEIIAPQSGGSSAILLSEMTGSVDIKAKIYGNVSSINGLRINSAVTSLNIHDMEFVNEFNRGIYVLTAPTIDYRVTRNSFKNATASTEQNLAVSALLIQGENDTEYNQFTVTNLPLGRAGLFSYATNGRKAGEGAGLGTGTPVFHDGINWIAFDSGLVVAD